MYTLKIGRRVTYTDIPTVFEAQNIYARERDLSGEGASTFPDGKLTAGIRISYNGRAWLADGTEYCEVTA